MDVGQTRHIASRLLRRGRFLFSSLYIRCAARHTQRPSPPPPPPQQRRRRPAQGILYTFFTPVYMLTFKLLEEILTNSCEEIK